MFARTMTQTRTGAKANGAKFSLWNFQLPPGPRDRGNKAAANIDLLDMDDEPTPLDRT